MPVLVEEDVKTTNATVARIGKLAGAAMVSALLSITITAIFRNSIGRMASHFLFVIVVAAIGLLMYWTGHMIDRFDAGLMLVVFLFEPAGRILLGIASVPTGILLA
ncbi:MAG: hypothetical protein WBC92_17675, partial [Terracidiphilus sp.]